MNTPMTSQKRKNAHHELMDIELFGEVTDGIYQLASIDKEDVNLAWKQIQESSFFGPKALKTPIHKFFSLLFKRRLEKSSKELIEDDYYRSSFNELINQYAQGLGTSQENALYLVYMNEFLNNPGAIFDEIDDFHLRDDKYKEFINSPIQDSFFDKLRFVHFKCEGSLQAYVLQDLLSPFAPYGGINEAGLSIGLVQREALTLNYEGENASYLALVTLLGCDTIESACDFLKQRQLVFHWEFHLKDESGNYKIVKIDGKNTKVLDGGEFETLESKSELKRHINIYQKSFLPISHACLSFDANSLALTLFDSKNLSIHHYFKKNVFTQDTTKISKGSRPTKKLESILKLKRLLNDAQLAFNENDEERCYHYLQLAIDHSKKNFSNDKELIAKLELIFCTCQYIYESHPETYQFILSNILKIHPSLPIEHQELANILIQRIQILANLKKQTPTANKLLKRIFFNESQLGKVAHLALKKTTLLRPNHLDFRPISGL
ncbi:hypothetical protein [Halobacteriovorax sp. DPLXC-1]|uniref:hypothetical protein n=1 Tax=Halobacteriovorax sp. DPLXC-1 TaxID=3110771 RepID=UPI002FEEFF9C